MDYVFPFLYLLVNRHTSALYQRYSINVQNIHYYCIENRFYQKISKTIDLPLN